MFETQQVWKYVWMLSGKGSKEMKQPKENGNVVKSLLICFNNIYDILAQIQSMLRDGESDC